MSVVSGRSELAFFPGKAPLLFLSLWLSQSTMQACTIKMEQIKTWRRRKRKKKKWWKITYSLHTWSHQQTVYKLRSSVTLNFSVDSLLMDSLVCVAILWLLDSFIQHQTNLWIFCLHTVYHTEVWGKGPARSALPGFPALTLMLTCAFV